MGLQNLIELMISAKDPVKVELVRLCDETILLLRLEVRMKVRLVDVDQRIVLGCLVQIRVPWRYELTNKNNK